MSFTVSIYYLLLYPFYILELVFMLHWLSIVTCWLWLYIGKFTNKCDLSPRKTQLLGKVDCRNTPWHQQLIIHSYIHQSKFTNMNTIYLSWYRVLIAQCTQHIPDKIVNTSWIKRFRNPLHRWTVRGWHGLRL